ncbi:MAG: insulinase family protein [Actinobacteria bacterium]|nr:MAG: insulinase family protein [Actinomycetota bacterium]
MFFDKTVLDNGITVVTETMDQVRSVALGFWVRVGSRDEPPGFGGMSHFIEHLLFKGTEKRTAEEISATFDRLGAELNAFTSKEYTCYYSRFLDEHLPTAVDVLVDMLQGTLFADEHVKSEREVVLEEIHLHEDTPDEQIHDLFAQTLFGSHPLGAPILGQTESVETFGRDDVTKYFSDYYLPENVVVAAAGRVKHDEVVSLVRDRLHLNERGEEMRKSYAPKPASEVMVRTKQTEQAHICYGTLAFDARSEDRFALTILDTILGGGMSSRLFREIREKKGLAYSVYSYHSLFLETGVFTVYAGTRPANAEEVIKLIQAELDDIVTNGVGEDEFAKVKDHLKGQLVLGLESTRNRMTRMGKSELTQGEVLSLDELVARIDRVTRDDVARVARELLRPDRMVLSVIGPFESEKLAHLLGEGVA